MRALVFDPFAGISGDMILGALVDLGLGADWLRDFVAALRLGDVGVVVERVDRRGLACSRVHFQLPAQHAHRRLRQVLDIVAASGAPPEVKASATSTFRRLAEAEGEVHGTGADEVHFHEVGALDAILDVLCGTAAVAELGVVRCYTRPVAIGHGWVEMAHGRFPVPAPATLKLLQGLPLRDDGLEGECTTPTGAALLATLTEGRRPPDAFVALRSGFGAGERDPADRPNCLRAVLAEVDEAGSRLLVVQADVDDMPPEYLPDAQERLLAAGAADAVVLPLAMKKGRLGARVEVLVPEPALQAVLAMLFQATSTIGVRYWPVTRPALPRVEDTAEWRGQRIRRKRVRLPDGRERIKPEHDDVARAAAALGVSSYEVRLALEAGAGDDAAGPTSPGPSA